MEENTTATGPVKVYNANDKIDAQRIIDLLKDENIIAFSHGSGSGDYLSISQGFSVYGEDIYVDASDEEAARALIAENTFSEDCVQDEPAEEENTEGVPFYRNRTKIARIIIGYFFLMVAIMYILNHFM